MTVAADQGVDAAPPPRDDATLVTLLCALGEAMVAAGAPVQSVRERLLRTASAYGAAHTEIAVLPTLVVVEVDDHRSRRHVTELSSPRGSLRFDQIDAVYRLQERCESTRLDPATATRAFREIGASRPPSPAWLRVLGHGLLTAGFSLLIQPSMLQLAICFALGIAIGLLKMARLHEFSVVFPVLVAFGVALLAFGLSEHVDALENPLRLLIPPLVTFLPAGAMTTGTAELAAGEMIAGASRLVSGLVSLLLLAFAILAAATLTGLPTSGLADDPVDQLGWWAGWVGLLLFTAGTFWHFAVPRTALAWMALVVVTAYAGQLIGAELFGSELSGFFGALAMTPVALWAAGRPAGPPPMITFLPGFWLLVPGSTGLIGVTEMLGRDGLAGGEAFGAAIAGIISIALGALVASSAYHAASTRRL